MTELTLEELAKLEAQLQVVDNPDEYVCGRCHADYHLNDERNEPSALCDGCAQEVAGDVTPRLLAMARELIRIRQGEGGVNVIEYSYMLSGGEWGPSQERKVTAEPPCGWSTARRYHGGSYRYRVVRYAPAPPATPVAELNGGG